jgi:hypothetical protein
VKSNRDALPPELAPSIKALQDKLLCTYVASLQDKSPRVRKKAARGLGYLGPAAAAAIPALGALSGDGNPAVREAVRWALARIATEAGVQSSRPWHRPRRLGR